MQFYVTKNPNLTKGSFNGGYIKIKVLLELCVLNSYFLKAF